MRKKVITLAAAVILFSVPVGMAVSQEGEMHKSQASEAHGMMGGGMGMGMMCPMMGMIGGMGGGDPTMMARMMEMHGEMMTKMGEVMMKHSKMMKQEAQKKKEAIK